MTSVLQNLLRGFALFLGLFALANLALIVIGRPGYDASIWWVDLRGWPDVLGHLLCLCFGLALVHRAVCPGHGGPRLRLARRLVILLMTGILLVNTLVVWRLHLTPGNGVTLGLPVPLTLLTAGLVGTLALTGRCAQPNGERTRRNRLASAATVALGLMSAALLSPLAQMTGYGQTDYRRPADVIVVYGCRAYASGRPSQALADRVNTACDLYHQGLAPRIVMSGGPGDGDIHETQAMMDYAVSLGVPADAILRDNHGLDTQSTANNLRAVLERDSSQAQGARSATVLAVSHDYHLPRTKLTLERQGFRAYTVPAQVRRGLPSKPYLMAREVAAWWVYWGNP